MTRSRNIRHRGAMTFTEIGRREGITRQGAARLFYRAEIKLVLGLCRAFREAVNQAESENYDLRNRSFRCTLLPGAHISDELSARI